MLNRLVRLAAFQNPEFYKAQSMRLSTFNKPRVIACGEEFANHIGLLRGCLAEVKALLKAHGIEPEVRDERFKRANYTQIQVNLTPCNSLISGEK